MKAFCFIVIFIAVSAFTGVCLAQTQIQPDHLCSEPEQREKLLRQHPELLQLEKQFEEYSSDWVRKYKQTNTEKSGTGRIIIPLVFHVLNEGGAENITDAQLIDEVRILNEDYNKQNADTSEAIGDFKYIIANMGVEWRLAKIDPNGNCTNGIDRITTDQTYVGDDYSKLNGWDRSKYINVWLMGQFETPGAAGYAYYPIDVATQYNTPWMDGVIILSNFMGSIGTSSPYTSKALTHEIGHCFSLEHCWGNTNSPEVSCGDDYVEDTPITMGWLSCPDSAASIVCTPGVAENYQNYMEYSYCSVMFTEGQKARWLASANSTIADRSNLWTDSNLIATGTYDTLPSPCAPTAAFSVATEVFGYGSNAANGSRYICTGTPVKLLNSSGNGAITSCLWHFPTGTTYSLGSSDTSTNPSVLFSNPGWQKITLTVANSLGSSSYTDSNLIYVSESAASIIAPYYQGFEDPNIFNEPNGWVSANYDANNHYDNNMTWFTQTTTAAHTGSGCAMLNNYNAHANFDVDEIISPALNMSYVASSHMQLSFYYSFATANQYLNGQDSIVVYATSTCGENWVEISAQNKLGSNAGNRVVNAGYLQSEFIPTSDPSYWKQVVIPLNSAWQKPNVHFKIRAFTSINGNNLYIDDFNVGEAAVPTGVEDVSAISNINLFPNPTSGDATLLMQLDQAGKVNVRVYDITGKEVLDPFDGWMNSGDNQVLVNGYNHLSQGVYVVSIVAGQSVVQRKMVVQ